MVTRVSAIGEIAMAQQTITSLLQVGQIARLIPSVSDSKREERATSSLLATLMVVPAFAQEVLGEMGAPAGKRAKIRCYTEVVFRTKDERKPRPDGLIVVTVGSREWTAFVESKVGATVLKKEQIEEYLDLAKELSVDAVITLSNQFAPLPTHHPLPISKQKTRYVELYHFSWLALVSKAIIVTENNEIVDTEQGYILNELVRYLQQDASGVSSLTRMAPGWKDLCAAVQQGATLSRNAEYVQESIASWHQLLRYLAIELGVAIAKPVKIFLSRARSKDPELNYQEDLTELVKDNRLHAEFDIPNAAARFEFSADFMRRTINLSMKIDAPKDKTRSTASINWLMRQLKGTDEQDLSIRAFWPKRIPMTSASLSSVLENPTILMPENVSDLPVSFEVVRVLDLAGRFKGAKTFVEDAAQAFPQYYAKVGQLLTKWVPKPPKVKEPVAVQDAVEIRMPSSSESIAPAHLEQQAPEVPSIDIEQS